MKKRLLFHFLVFSVCQISCTSTNNIAGTYRSNFAVNGFFGTTITMNSDSTFSYRMRGDLMFDTSNGHYKIQKKYVVLYHLPFQPDTSEYKTLGKEAVLLSYALSTNNHLNGPEKYLIGRKKLFVCDRSGKAVKRNIGYSKRRKFLLFGTHLQNKRYYLKRIH